ncbi:SLAM family member 5-like [Sardina pilchardus]|uniref:SLAM family member 5-like n=1 Tax=Sardina pilchardus TaxID=27697 RepID=UPI002E0FA4A4
MKGNYSLDLYEINWILNDTYNVVKYYPPYNTSGKLVVSEWYKGIVELNYTTFSLELRNLQKNDSGLYRGEIITVGSNFVVEYRLSIFEQVSPILSVQPVLSSGDLCNITVTCTAGDLSLTSTCDSSTCTQKELTGSSSLAIFIRDGVIICNHSNPLSWSNSTVTLCQDTPVLAESHRGDTELLRKLLVAGGLALGGLLICGVLYFRMHVTSKGSLSLHIYQSVEALSTSPDVKRSNLTKSQCSSSYAEIGPSQNALRLSSVECPPCTYSQIQPHTGPSTDLDTTKPEHVYSSVSNV